MLGLGPKPSALYLERQALTRLPGTPTLPAGNDGNNAAFQSDPGVGTQTPGDGLNTAGLMAIVVSIWPQPGATLTGGTLKCWMFSKYRNQWARCPDLDLTIDTTGAPAQIFMPMKQFSRLGFFINWLTSAVTLGGIGGSDVLIELDGFDSVLGMGS